MGTNNWLSIAQFNEKYLKGVSHGLSVQYLHEIGVVQMRIQRGAGTMVQVVDEDALAAAFAGWALKQVYER
jgi:hypothetical protein